MSAPLFPLFADLRNRPVRVVGGGAVAERKVEANRTVGSGWVVTDGLKPGDKVIVQGVAKIRPGAPIRPVPASKPQVIAAPKPDSKG